MRKLLLYCLLLMFFASKSYAQSRQITGTVTDNEGKPMEFVTVAVAETQKATSTDIKGFFKINAENGQNLRFSFVGVKTITITVTAATHDLKIQFKDNQTALNEVVVTGYASERKKDLTGAVAVVDLAPVKNNSSGNTMQAL